MTRAECNVLKTLAERRRQESIAAVAAIGTTKRSVQLYEAGSKPLRSNEREHPPWR